MTWRDTVIVLYCKALHSNEWCCIAWCVIALHGMAWYGVAWHGGHDVAWYGNGLHCIGCMALHYMSWCGIAWHGLLYCSYMNTAAEIHVLGCFLEERLPCYKSFEALRLINLTLRSGLEREERLAKGCPKAGHWLKEDSQALAGLAVK